MQRWVRAKAPLGYLINRRPFRLLQFVMQMLYSPMHSNPLEVQYYSNVPFLLGEGQAVQYSLKPTREGRSRIPMRPAENYLRDAMVRTLTEGDWEMDFMVQVQTDPHLMPIENACRALARGAVALRHRGAGPDARPAVRLRRAARVRRRAALQPLAQPARAPAARELEPGAAHDVLGAREAAAVDEQRRARRADGRGDVRMTDAEHPVRRDAGLPPGSVARPHPGGAGPARPSADRGRRRAGGRGRVRRPVRSAGPRATRWHPGLARGRARRSRRTGRAGGGHHRAAPIEPERCGGGRGRGGGRAVGRRAGGPPSRKQGPTTSSGPRPGLPSQVAGVISPPLRTAEGRRSAGVDEAETTPVMIELNLRYEGGPKAALRELRRAVGAGHRPRRARPALRGVRDRRA